MIPEEALRYLAHEAARCRDRDTAESICLLLPAMLRLMCAKPMDPFEALSFQLQLRQELREQWLPGQTAEQPTK